MKKVNGMKIKSFLLAMLMLLSLSITISATNGKVQAEAADIHDINCKFNCVHMNFIPASPSSNGVTRLSEEELIKLIAETNDLSEEEVSKIRFSFNEATISATNEKVQAEAADIHDINCKFNCVHMNFIPASPSSDGVTRLSEEELIKLIAETNGLSEEEVGKIQFGLNAGADDKIQSFSSCQHILGSHTCGSQVSKGNCIVVCYGTISCIFSCGLSYQQVEQHEAHTWSNGGVCGMQCTNCGRVIYNTGHGPGSGHSWCTND